MELYNIKSQYENFNYPKEFLRTIELGLINFDCWYYIPLEQMETRIAGVMKRYPNRKLVPFARRADCDDIACFEIGKESKVQIIHDFASAGYEQRKEYEHFWDWFQDAINEMIEEDECND